MTGRPDLGEGAARTRQPRLAIVSVVALLPWSWFVLRDAAGAAGDVLAIVLPAVVVLVVVSALVAGMWRRRWLLPAGSVLAMGTVAVLGPWLPADAGAVVPGTAITAVGANIQASADSAGSLLGQSPDVLVVVEMTPGAEAVFEAAYPHHEVAYTSAPAGGPNVAVYSRLPIRVLDGPGPSLPGIRALVQGPAGPFVLYALHVPRPWFTTRGEYQATVVEHHALVEGIAARVAAEPLPVVVLGDLNSPDRGRDYRLLLDRGGLVDAMRDRLAAPTSVAKWTPFLLRIDHLLVSNGWCGDAAARFALPASDHRGIRATIGPCIGGRSAGLQ